MKFHVLVLWCLVDVLSRPAIAAPPTWVEIPVGIKGSRNAFDSSSVTIDGAQRTAWVMISFDSTYRFEPDKTPTSKILVLMTFDCNRITVQAMREIHYDPNGKPFYTVEQPTLQRAAAPKTVDRAQLDAVCAVPRKNWARRLLDLWVH